IWSQRWTSAEARLEAVESGLAASGAVVRRGGVYDGWDPELRGGLLGSARLRLGVEEHGGGNPLVGRRAWPRSAAAAPAPRPAPCSSPGPRRPTRRPWRSRWG